MTLAAGARLGPYTILGLIGAGGMGEVYSARDTRLDRPVALKLLPPEVSGDPGRRARFEREAKIVAGLSHPHICTLYDVGEHHSSTFLVMELLVGETLADRIARGPLPLSEALTVATQIADALAGAHRQGIIHRDLKPGNIMLTRSGAKLLDFGLGKLIGDREHPGDALVLSAITQSSPLTANGVIVGTPQYMAPEQLEGKPADARADIWALGATIYEMVTGTRAFEGTNPVSVMTAIMSSEPPPMTVVQPETPAGLARIATRCLAKDPDRRWQSAADLADELRWIQDAASFPGAVHAPRIRAHVLAGIVLLMIGAALAAMVAERMMRRAPAVLPSHVTISVAAPGLTLANGGLAISPDGLTIVFVARAGDDFPRLYERALDAWDARPLKGTELATNPFFSPDGKWIAFVAGGKLQKMQLRDGTPQSICTVNYQGFSRGYWGPDGRILFSQWPGGLSSVSSEGGTPQPVANAPTAEHYLWPQLRPGGQTLVFTVLKTGHASIAAMTLATRQIRTVVETGSCARYLPTGHLVYESEGRLRAVAFDLQRAETLGESRVVIDDIAIEGALTTAGLDYDISATGTIVYFPASAPKSALVWKDRTGHRTPLKFVPRSYAFPSLSSDGRHVTVSVMDWPAMNVWVGSVDGEPLSRLSGSFTGLCSIFSPDGRWIVFTSSEGNGWFNLFRARADGSGRPERLQDVPRNQKPTTWLRSDQLVLFNSQDQANRDIVAIDVGSHAIRPLLNSAAHELEAAFSPDGRWVAYQSDESGLGKWEIYVRPYAGTGPAHRVSVDGGMGAAWNPQGGELFYQSRTALMSVRIENGIPRPPTKVFGSRKSEDYRREFDVAPDGQRFLFLEPATPRTDISMASNWFDELKARVPVR